MMTISNRHLAVTLLMMLSTVLFSHDQEAVKNRYSVTSPITIGSEPDYPPYCMVDEKGGAEGFAIDLFKAAARAVGLEVNVRIGVWDILKNDLASGKIDALPLVGRTPQREHLFDFTMSYISLHGAVFVRKGTRGIHSIQDLKHKEIVVMKGDNAEEFLRREKISDKIFTKNTFGDAFRALAKGEHDVVVTQRVMGLRLLKNMGIASIVPLDLQLPQFRQDFCFAVQKGNSQLLSRLNEGLSILIADGTYHKIREKWLLSGIDDPMSLEKILRLLSSILIPLIVLIAFASVFILRREVKRRTRDLRAEIAERKKTETALRDSEAKLRRITDNITDVVFTTDLNFKITYISPSVKKLTGITTRDYMDKSLAERYSPESRRKFKSLLSAELAKERDGAMARNRSLVIEAEHYLADGGTITVLLHVSFLRKENGKPIGLLGVMSDITERKESENELRRLKNMLENLVKERTAELQEKVDKLDRSQKAMLYMVEDLNLVTAELKDQRLQLERANRELEAFTYSVSHDLRAPLRTINGFSEFLMEDYAHKLDDEGKRFIKTIQQGTQKMDRLIADLLTLSRTSLAEIKLTQVDMRQLARSVFDEIATDKEKNAFSTTFRKMPVSTCDMTLIKQVWQNLISNALKYSARSDTKKIEVGARRNKQEMIFFIRDHGVGFDNKYKDKLFGVFQRLHKADEFSGTGVGLAIVQRIVHRHGGSVWAEGEINKGATVYFSLPIRETAIQEKETCNE